MGASDFRYQVWLYRNEEREDLLAECHTDHVFGIAATLWSALCPYYGFGIERNWRIQVEQELLPPGEKVLARL